MNNLQEFNFKGNNVRTVQIDSKPYFVGKDVAKILGYSRPQKAVRDLVDQDDQKTLAYKACPNLGLWSNNDFSDKTIINESGMYSLIMNSQMPNAKQFKHWVTGEVLPSIRKHGAYMTPEKIEEALLNPDTIINLAQQLKSEREGRLIAEKNVKSMKPKALFADSVSTSKTDISVGDMAKILKGNGIDIGRNRFFEWLRDNGYLIKQKGNDYNSPTQKSMELGLFRVKESSRIDSNGMAIILKTPIVTGKGQQYFVNKFLSENEKVEA